MSLTAQHGRLIDEIDDVVGHLNAFHDLHAQLRETVLDDHRTAYTLVENLRDDFTGLPADAFFSLHQEMAGKARLALQQFGDHTNLVRSLHDQLHDTRTTHTQHVTNTLGQVPDTVWEFLGDRTTIPSLADVTTLGENAAESLLTVWDRHVPAQMPHHESDPVTGFLHWTYDHTIGAISAEVGNLFHAITSWGLDLGVVRDVVGSVDALLQSFYANVQGIFHTHLTMALGSPCSQKKEGDQPHLPPEPPASSLTHSKADLQQRTQQIHDYLTHHGQNPPYLATYDQFAPFLKDLSIDDIQQIEHDYQVTYGHPITDDIYQSFGSSFDLYRLMRQLDPGSFVMQTDMSSPLDPNAKIQTPPYPIVPTGTQGTFSITDRHLHVQHALVLDPNGQVVTYADESALDGPLTTIKPYFDQTGAYTVVFEVVDDRDHKMHYYTYQQQVADAKDLAQAGYVQMMAQGGAQTRDQYMQHLHDMEAEVKQFDAKDYDAFKSSVAALDKTLTSNCVAIPAYFAAKTGEAQMFGVALFIKPMGNGTYQIIDATNPQDIRTYPDKDHGGSIDDSWNAMMGDNPWPDGQLTANIPHGGATGIASITWTTKTVENNSPSLGKQVQGWLSGIAFLAGLGGFFCPPLFMVAGLAGLGAEGINVFDQVQHGDWQWDWNHISQLLVQTGFNLLMFAGVGGDSSALADLFGTSESSVAAKMSDIAAGRVSQDAIQSLATKAKMSPDLLVAIAKDPRIFGMFQASGADAAYFDKMLKDYNALPAATRGGKSFYDYYFTFDIPVVEGSPLKICRYQQERLDAVKQTLSKQDPATLTAAERRVLANDPMTLMYLANNAKFDLEALNEMGGDILEGVATRSTRTGKTGSRTKLGTDTLTQLRQTTAANGEKVLVLEDDSAIQTIEKANGKPPGSYGGYTVTMNPDEILKLFGKTVSGRTVVVVVENGATDAEIMEEYEHAQLQLARLKKDPIAGGNTPRIDPTYIQIEEANIEGDILRRASLPPSDPAYIKMSNDDIAKLQTARQNYYVQPLNSARIYQEPSTGLWVEYNGSGIPYNVYDYANETWNQAFTDSKGRYVLPNPQHPIMMWDTTAKVWIPYAP